MNVWPKRCRCCGAAYLPHAWTKLPLVGFQGDDEERLELRNCTLPCMTTLAVHVEPTGVPWTHTAQLADTVRPEAA